MFKPLWLALAALGLWASLIPQVTYPSVSSGEPSDQILVAWPGWGVQQDLGHLSGTVGTFHVWVSAEPRGDHVTVWASLVDASTREVLRQSSINATPDSIAVLRTLTFPGYVVPEGQRLILQLQVAEFEHNYVIYRLASAQSGLANVAANGVPDVGDGPLAFAHVDSGSGLRAAILGEQSERVRLVLAVIFGMLSILVHPSVVARMRQMRTAASRIARRPTAWARRLVGPGAEPGVADSPTMFGHVLSAPWYPWPVATIPILHFLASNPLHFAVSEVVVPLVVVLAVVTGSMVGLRLFLKDWHRPAAAISSVTVVVFAYGHIERALDGRVDERLFFAGTVVLGAAFVAKAIQPGGLGGRWIQFLNVVAAMLLAIVAASLASGTAEWLGRASTSESTEVDDLAAHLLAAGAPAESVHRPDIFYVILDEYARHDALGDFDNSDFLYELERRRFYVPLESTSNYMNTQQSMASSLNMGYLNELGKRTPATHADMVDIIQNNYLAATLKSLGYTYVHLESGHQFASKAPLADFVVTFRPSGVDIVGTKRSPSGSSGPTVFRRFLRELALTTALRPIVGHRFLSDEESPFDWWSPHRALRMFEFLANPIEVDGPKFVFAHITKPHSPASFDRYGNYLVGTTKYDGFSDSHDPSVPDAYTGQLIYINSLVLNMIDGIFRNSNADPIVVIAADHGRSDLGYSKHHTLAAFHLPDGGNSAVYTSISSVNHFRAILDYYFGVDIGLLEDRTIEHVIGQYNFANVSGENRD